MSTLQAQMQVRVARKTVEAEDICSFELVAVDGAPLPPFEAGAHIDVHLPGDLVRQYSLCNAPGETHRYRIGVLRAADSRGGSRAMHETVEVGSVLPIGAPRNHFPLVPARRSLLLAGGIGVTPLLAMAEALAAAGAAFDLHYYARSPARVAFRDRFGASSLAGRVHVHDGAAGGKPDPAALLAAAAADTHLYVCGPQGFIERVLAAARSQGWPGTRLHTEYFGAAAAGAAARAGSERAFDVRLAASGRIVRVGPDSTAIEALAAHGIAIPYACGEGVCGTCLTRVLDGVPDHRDLYLTADERAANDRFTPCCSRAKTDLLVLDL